MKIALCGYGKMGKTIEGIAVSRGHEISARFTRNNPPNAAELAGADLVIEFTEPNAAVDNISICLSAGKPVVSGTTGWYSRLEEMQHLATAHQTALFTASNFSIGVNILFQANALIARLMQGRSGYRVRMEEIHHIHKKDAPSGTAISLAEGILNANADYTAWQEADAANHNQAIPIKSIRTDEVPGTHLIQWDSAEDSIALSHIAHNRNGFALGAVLAAEFTLGRKGAFGMKDLLQF
jgi:4-hydroxy-tetrahydrodipicolinate reductase